MPSFLRTALVLILVAAVGAEGYYISSLHRKISRQSDELKNISVQLQTLRDERTRLREELSSIKKITGEHKDGNTSERQN